MKERYIILKKLYPNYLVLIKTKNKTKLFKYKYETLGIDKKIFKYLKGKYLNQNVNYIILENLEIIEIKTFVNNQYEIIKSKVITLEIINSLIESYKESL